MPDKKPVHGTYAYNKKYYDKYRAKKAKIDLVLSPETKEEIVNAAQAVSQSTNQYILTAVQTRMDTERGIDYGNVQP